MVLLSTVFRSNWNLKMLVFVEGGKPEYPEKNQISSKALHSAFPEFIQPVLSTSEKMSEVDPFFQLWLRQWKVIPYKDVI